MGATRGTSKCTITYLKQCEMHPRLLSYRMTQRLFTARKNHKPKQDLTKHFNKKRYLYTFRQLKSIIMLIFTFGHTYVSRDLGVNVLDVYKMTVEIASFALTCQNLVAQGERKSDVFVDNA